MGIFTRKPKVVKDVPGGAWGHLVSDHGIDVDTLSKDIRCVERAGALESTGQTVNFLRFFKPGEAAQKGVVVTGWETFDEHPELILFEGYLTHDNKAHLTRKRA